MPVTELAILPLTHALTKEDTSSLPNSLIPKLRTAKSVLETASGHPFHYFQQVEDPSILYLVGKWESVAAHAAFLPSADNRRLLALLKDDIVMESDDAEKKMAMWHLDTDVFCFDGSESVKSVFTAKTIRLDQYFVPKEKNAVFAERLGEVRGLLESFTKPYQVVGGWRIEKEEEAKEEWELFLILENVEHPFEFPEFKEILACVERLDVRHLRAIEGL